MRWFTLPVLSLASEYQIPESWDSEYTCGRDDIPSYVPCSESPVRVHIFFRHGMRTDFQRHSCFPNGAQPEYKCSLKTQVGFDNKMSRPSLLVKDYKEGCEIGQLVDYSEIQMTRLGGFLKQAYGTVIESASTTQDRSVYLRSTDKARTLGSLDLLLEAIMGNSRKTLNVHTQQFEEDPLTLNVKKCPKLDYLNAQFASSDSVRQLTTDSAYYKQCATMWDREIGTPFSLVDAGDCLFAPKCAKVPLPNNIVPSEDLYACVWNLFNSLRHLKYGYLKLWKEGSDFSNMATTPIWKELLKVANDRHLKVSFWATHDDTLASMLSSVGLWDGTWPRYASLLLFEEYPDGHIRVIRDGVEIAQRASWAELVPAYALEPEKFKTACQSTPKPELGRSSFGDLLLRGLGVSALVNILTG
jgi:hypothetical protein